MQNRSYAQNREDVLILNHLKGFTGTVVEFGANDGVTLSNSKLLIENGHDAILIEPSSVFNQLQSVHKSNPKVSCENVAIGESCGNIDFYESGAHVKGGKDHALVSTTDIKELSRWPDVNFEKKTVQVIDVATLRSKYPGNWDVISIDCEGLDWSILKQIDLKEVDCKVLCIEWNSHPDLALLFISHCAMFGLEEIHRNAENIIFAKLK